MPTTKPVRGGLRIFCVESSKTMDDAEPQELGNWQKSQAARQVAEAIDAVAAIARSEFSVLLE